IFQRHTSALEDGTPQVSEGMRSKGGQTDALTETFQDLVECANCQGFSGIARRFRQKHWPRRIAPVGGEEELSIAGHIALKEREHTGRNRHKAQSATFGGFRT